MIECLYSDYILVLCDFIHLVFNFNFLFHEIEAFLKQNRWIFKKPGYTRIYLVSLYVNQFAWKFHYVVLWYYDDHKLQFQLFILMLSISTRIANFEQCFILVKQYIDPKNQVYTLLQICHNIHNIYCILIIIACFVVFMIYDD